MAITEKISLEFQQLTDTSKELSSISAEMKNLTDQMSELIEEIKILWPDENGKTFAGRFETEVQPQFEKYYGTVQEYSDYIKGAHDRYVAHHEATKAGIEAKAA